MKKGEKTQRVTYPLVVPQELYDRIEAVSQRYCESRSTVMRFALRIGLAKLEPPDDDKALRLTDKDRRGNEKAS